MGCCLDTDSILGLPQSIEIDKRPDKKFRQGFIGAPAAAGQSENDRFPCSPPKAGRAASSYAARVGLCPGVGPEGWRRWSAHPFGAVCRGHAQDPVFAPDPLLLRPALQKWQLGFFGLFVPFVQNLPQLHVTQLFLVPYSFFVFCCSRRGLSRCKHCSKWSQVPACLSLSRLV